jgi:hypothetical protein
VINPVAPGLSLCDRCGATGWRLGGRSERPDLEPERSPGEPAGKLVWLLRLKSRSSYTVDLSVHLGSRKFTARAVAREYSEHLVQERFESFGGTTTQGGHGRHYLFKLRVITNVIITYIA